MRNLTRAVCQKANRGGYTEHHCVQDSLKHCSQYKKKDDATPCYTTLSSSVHDLIHTLSHSQVCFYEISDNIQSWAKTYRVILQCQNLCYKVVSFVCWMTWQFVLWALISYHYFIVSYPDLSQKSWEFREVRRERHNSWFIWDVCKGIR